jgi:two-component system, cell cycle sensor histidine kinase and response regulator CckA
MQTVSEKSLITLDSLPEAYIRLDSKFRCTFVNQAAQLLLDQTEVKLLGKRLWDVYPENTAKPLEEGFRRTMTEHTVSRLHLYEQSRGRRYSMTALPETNDDILVQLSDTTERESVGPWQQQTKSESRIHGIPRNLPGFVYQTHVRDNGEWSVIFADKRALDIFGIDPEPLETVFKRFAACIAPEDQERFINSIRESTRSGEDWEFEGRFIKPTGETKYIQGVSRARRLGDETVYDGIILDVTPHKHAERALRESEEKFSKSFHSNPAAIVIADITSQSYLEVNEAFERITGYRRDEIVGRSWLQVCLWAGSHEWDRALQRLLNEGCIRNLEFRFRKKSGEFGTGLLSAELIEIGGHQCAITATIDITERIRLEMQLRQAQKLEGLGRLAGGVAHDFNNLLMVINGYSDFVLKRLAADDPLYLPAQEINKAGERAASLTKQLLAFSRKQIIEPRPLDLNVIVNDTERMFQRLIGEDIELAISLDPLLGQIMADAAQIQQVIMNLVVNARDAMTDGGKLEITTKNIDIDERAAGAHSDAAPGRYVLMTVTDTGIGMNEETMQRIFDPFFTTKRQDTGTGLGLAMVYGVVRQGGGWIEVLSQLGQGASFKIYFPRIDDRSVRDSVGSPIPMTLYGGETVLVVEDQEEVRRLIQTILESYGYHVLEAENGTAALLLAEGHPGEIDLLLTDVILPGMNGKTLSEHIRVLLPKLKVIFTSGYPADVISRRGVLEQDVAYLPKPFSPESLAVKVREVLTGRSTSP